MKDGLAGRLIVVEGIDGSGKSTQVYLLKRWLELEGLKVSFTEWNSSDLVRRATKRGKKKFLLTPTTFSLIHSTDFADRYERAILPRLHNGDIVLADRYIYTAFARDTVRGCSPAWVRQLYDFAMTPHISFFFKVPLDVAMDRILTGRPKLKYHEAGMDMGFSSDIYDSFRKFQSKINENYIRMISECGFETIDATLPIEEQQEIVRRIVEERIDLAAFRRRSAVR
ncbi:MAG: thymidylate kinase [Acidobacteria bacterium]|nr:thymidylate kinase [Acidobacteriota bacterium]